MKNKPSLGEGKIKKDGINNPPKTPRPNIKPTPRPKQEEHYGKKYYRGSN